MKFNIYDFDECFKSFHGRTTSEQIKGRKLARNKQILNFIKKKCFSKEHSQWRIKPTLSFLTKNQYNQNEFVEFLVFYFAWYYHKYPNAKGEKSSYKYLRDIQKSKMLNKTDSSYMRLYIPVNRRTQFIKIIHDINHEGNNLSQVKLIEFIIKHFEIGYAENTLRNKINDLTNEKLHH